MQAAPTEDYYRTSQVPYNQQQYNQNVPAPGMQFNQRFEPQQQQQQQQQPQQYQPPVQQARIAEPEKPKAPIPEQHVHLKTVLDELRHQCYETAKNPVRKLTIDHTKRNCPIKNKLIQTICLQQTKRKIEDVSKKLEVLYDCLRENAVSHSPILTTLYLSMDFFQFHSCIFSLADTEYASRTTSNSANDPERRLHERPRSSHAIGIGARFQ